MGKLDINLVCLMSPRISGLATGLMSRRRYLGGKYEGLGCVCPWHRIRCVWLVVRFLIILGLVYSDVGILMIGRRLPGTTGVPEASLEILCDSSIYV